MENNNNSQQKEFLAYFQMLKEQPDSDYNRDQFVKLKNYMEFLYDCFMWNYRFDYFKLFISFTNFDISGDEFADEFMNLQTSTVICY